MKKQAKKVIALFLALTMVITFGACNTSSTLTKTLTITSPAFTTTVTNAGGPPDNVSGIFPVTIRTQVNWNDIVTETLDAPPTKILVGGMSMVDFLVYFGLEDLIYTTVYTGPSWNNLKSGLTGELKTIAESVPVLNDNYSISLEEFYVLKDAGIDMILSGYVTVGYPNDMAAEDFVKEGIPFVYPYYLKYDGTYRVGGGHLCSSADVFDAYRDLGRILGIGEKVEEYIQDQHRQMNDIIAKIGESKYSGGRTVLFVAINSRGTYLINYVGNTIEEYVQRSGNNYISEYGTGLITASYETILAIDPDIIIYKNSEIGGIPLEEVEALQALKAVRNGTVYAANLPVTSNSSGMDLAGDFRTVASILYPDVDFGA